MPRGDRRGPDGFGAMTGRGIGWRNQQAVPAYLTPTYSKEQEIEILKNQAEAMKASLESINKRLEDLDK